MDIELLRTFLEVSRTRHFGQTAEILHLTQSAVSARIKTLENMLGIRLFDRLNRDIRLTPEGHRLVHYANGIIAHWRKARQDVSSGAAVAQLSVGGSVRLWDIFLQEWLHQVRSEKPEMALIAEMQSPEILTRKLLDGILDLAFMLEPPQLEVLNIEEIYTLNLILVSDHPGLSIDEALDKRYLMVDWGLGHALTHRRLFPDAPEPLIRLGTASMALSHIHSLGGSAYLPEVAVEAQLESGLFHRVEDAPMIIHGVHAVYPVRSHRLDLVKEVLALFDNV